MEAFDDACEKLLWPEKRAGRESIWRTAAECTVQLPGAAIPEPLRTLLQPQFEADGWLRLGPIPAGMPLALLANVDPEIQPRALSDLFVRMKKTLAEMPARKLDAAAFQEAMRKEVLGPLFKASKCPDLIEDRGHTFGAGLPEDDKRALIEFLKTI